MEISNFSIYRKRGHIRNIGISNFRSYRMCRCIEISNFSICRKRRHIGNTGISNFRKYRICRYIDISICRKRRHIGNIGISNFRYQVYSMSRYIMISNLYKPVRIPGLVYRDIEISNFSICLKRRYIEISNCGSFDILNVSTYIKISNFYKPISLVLSTVISKSFFSIYRNRRYTVPARL